MHREVCLKHRKNRREIFLRVRTQVPSWQRCLFFFVVSGAGVTARAAFRGHRSRAGCLSANQAMPVQVRLTAPILENSKHGGRHLAQLGLQNLVGSGQHRDAVPFFKVRGRQEVRQRPHKPPIRRFDCVARVRLPSKRGAQLAGRWQRQSGPRYQFPGPLDHSGGHSPRKRESTVQSRGGPPFQIGSPTRRPPYSPPPPRREG